MKDRRISDEGPIRIERREQRNTGKYVSGDKGRQPELTGLNATESAGYDPYNSGIFDVSKSWDSHSRFKRNF